MNTWNPSSASCDVAEDKAEGLHQDIGVFGSSGGSLKLSYRSLIFGSNGRRQNRPISERTRAAESLFLAPTDDPDAPPTVMYANSTAFNARSSRSSNNNSADENEGMTVLELMSHSRLWKELRGETLPDSSESGNKPARDPFYSFDTLPVEMRQSMKDIILHALGNKTLTGDQVLLEAQCRNWDNAPEGWKAARAYCSINVVVTALCELVKEGVVDCIQKIGPEWEIKHWNPLYRRAKPRSSTSGGATVDASPAVGAHAVMESESKPTRSLKISKPWKRT